MTLIEQNQNLSLYIEQCNGWPKKRVAGERGIKCSTFALSNAATLCQVALIRNKVGAQA